MRLRVTLPPNDFGTANPTLARACPSTRRQTAAKNGPESREPLSYTLWNSERLRSRASFGKDRAWPARSIGLLGVANSSLRAYGQLLAALGSAARQDGPAILRPHADPEAVSLGPLAIVWLKCSFRHLGAPARVQRSSLVAPSRQDGFRSGILSIESLGNRCQTAAAPRLR